MSVAAECRVWGKGGIYHVLLVSLLLLMALQPFADVAGGLLLRSHWPVCCSRPSRPRRIGAVS